MRCIKKKYQENPSSQQAGKAGSVICSVKCLGREMCLLVRQKVTQLHQLHLLLTLLLPSLLCLCARGSFGQILPGISCSDFLGSVPATPPAFLGSRCSNRSGRLHLPVAFMPPSFYTPTLREWGFLHTAGEISTPRIALCPQPRNNNPLQAAPSARLLPLVTSPAAATTSLPLQGLWEEEPQKELPQERDVFALLPFAPPTITSCSALRP